MNTEAEFCAASFSMPSMVRFAPAGMVPSSPLTPSPRTLNKTLPLDNTRVETSTCDPGLASVRNNRHSPLTNSLAC